MTVELVQRTFPDRPDWVIVEDNVPLGTKYEVMGFEARGAIMNMLTGEIRPIDLYLLKGNDDLGWMPTVCFRTVTQES